MPDGALLFGSVGRLAEAKNPLFQVNILKSLRNSGISAYLVLVGEGPLKERVKDYADTLGLGNYVFLPGNSVRPEAYLSAMDVFTMPSFFEGAPFAVVEACANGLPMLLSKEIPVLDNNDLKEVHLVIQDVNLWVNEAIRQWQNNDVTVRREGGAHVRKMGMDRVATTKRLEEVYRS